MNLNLLAVAATAFAGLIALLAGWVQRMQAERTGAALAAAKVTQATAETQAAVAQAVVDAPHSQADVAAALNGGTF